MNRSLRAMATLTTVGWAMLPCVAHTAEPNVGECLTASDSSLKLNAEHKLRAERAQLLVCAAESCPAEIRQECLRRVEQVNQSLPSIVFEVKDSAGNDVRAVKVTMDNEPLAEHLDGMALTVDPGEHKFAFEIPGQPRLEKQLFITVAQKNRHEFVSFTPVGVAPSAALPEPPSGLPPAAEASRGLSGQRIAAIASGGVGIVGIGVGITFGLLAKSKRDDANEACPETYCRTQDGVDQWDSARRSGNVSTVAFIVGGVGLAGAAALWFTDSSTSPERTQVGLGLGGLQVRGTW